MSRAAPAASPTHPDLEWAASGAMALTGPSDGPPRLAPAPIATAARAAVCAIAEVAGASAPLDASRLRALDAPALLGERAALFGHTRHGVRSVGETCHLLPCVDGWIAVNLARREDWSLLPAWLGEGCVEDPREFVAAKIATRDVSAVVERARLLGLPVAPAIPAGVTDPSDWLRTTARGPARRWVVRTPPLVVDLSSLWAGPLCTHLLEMAGARVIKVESTARPDGARRGVAAFFDLVNGGKRSIALDFSSNDGLRALRGLIESADIVVEGSRPRALRALGIVAEDIVATRPGRVWVSITGYGREEPMGSWVAFGDDAAAAAGLLVWPQTADGEPSFCGDAIADPLTGIHAAHAALSCWQRGDSAVLDVALQRVAAFVANQPVTVSRGEVRSCSRASGARGWEVVAGGDRCEVAPARARTPAATARELGADTRDVLQELGIRC